MAAKTDSVNLAYQAIALQDDLPEQVFILPNARLPEQKTSVNTAMENPSSISSVPSLVIIINIQYNPSNSPDYSTTLFPPSSLPLTTLPQQPPRSKCKKDRRQNKEYWKG